MNLSRFEQYTDEIISRMSVSQTIYNCHNLLANIFITICVIFL